MKEHPILIFVYLGILVGLTIRTVRNPTNVNRWVSGAIVGAIVYLLILIIGFAVAGSVGFSEALKHLAIPATFALATMISVIIGAMIGPLSHRNMAAIIFAGIAVIYSFHMASKSDGTKDLLVIESAILGAVAANLILLAIKNK